MALEPIQGGAIAHRRRSRSTRKRGATFETRRKMQVVFQDPYGSFNPRHRVDRLITEPFHLLGSAAPTGAERDKRIARALDRGRPRSRPTRKSTSTNSPAASASASPSPAR